MSLRKNETLTGWTLLQHICLHFWAWLLNTIAITPKSEDKYVVKVFNPSEFHLSEVTFFQNWYFSRDCFPKFANGQNVKIDIVHKVYEWPSCLFVKMIPCLENHFGKRTACSLFLNYAYFQGMGCEGACEMNSETSVRSVCVRAFFPLVTPTHVRPHTFLTFQGKLMDISDFICEL